MDLSAGLPSPRAEIVRDLKLRVPGEKLTKSDPGKTCLKVATVFVLGLQSRGGQGPISMAVLFSEFYGSEFAFGQDDQHWFKDCPRCFGGKRAL